MLRRLAEVPAGLAACTPDRLEALLGGPALIEVPGRRDPPVFVSVLLHGNEVSGWNALRRLLRHDAPLPRSVLLFVGNVRAAAAGVRTLPGQQDFNRIWRGATGDEGRLAGELLDALAARPLFAAVDLHNNTGHNPYYGIVTELAPAHLGLAYLFGDKAVYVREPDTVLTRALTPHCPAVAVELGPIGDARCDERAYEFLKRVLALDAIPAADTKALKLFRTRVRVHVADEVEFAFAGEDRRAPLVLTGGVEGVNFHELPAGTEFGATASSPGDVLRVLDVNHRDVTDQFFVQERGRLRLRQAVVPAMYTTDPLVIRQDCLCYFMERLPESASAASPQK